LISIYSHFVEVFVVDFIDLVEIMKKLLTTIQMSLN